MFRIAVAQYSLLCSSGKTMPNLYGTYGQRAKLIDRFLMDDSMADTFFLAVAGHDDWPFLVVVQDYSPAVFEPGAVIVPETGLLMIGAGERLLAYDLGGPTRLWEDKADTGFWAWKRYDQIIVMSAELELAAWDIHGNKKWSTFVEPPWEYRVEHGIVSLDVMGTKSSFPLDTGPSQR